MGVFSNWKAVVISSGDKRSEQDKSIPSSEEQRYQWLNITV